MAVCDKNVRYTLSNVTRRKSSLEAKLFPNTEHLLWATRLSPKNERLRILANRSLPSKVDSTLTCLSIHQRRGKCRLDYLKAKRLEQRHVLLRGEGRGQGGGKIV